MADDDWGDRDAGSMYEFNPSQEMAEPRKRYGTTPPPNFAALLPSAGDPVFNTDSQNNDEFYIMDSDVPREVEDTSQPSYDSEG